MSHTVCCTTGCFPNILRRLARRLAALKKHAHLVHRYPLLLSQRPLFVPNSAEGRSLSHSPFAALASIFFQSVTFGGRRRGRNVIMRLNFCVWLIFYMASAASKINRTDIYFAAFFPMTPPHSHEGLIGHGVMPAVKLAIKHINQSPNILKGYKLHMYWNDTEVRIPCQNTAG